MHPLRTDVHQCIYMTATAHRGWGDRRGAHPGVVEQAGNLLVAKEGEHLGRGAGRDAEVVEE